MGRDIDATTGTLVQVGGLGQLREHLRHAVGIVFGLAQDLEAHAVGFLLGIAGKSELLLHDCCLPERCGARGEVAGAGDERRSHGSCQGGEQEVGGLVLLRQAARDVTLRHV